MQAGSPRPRSRQGCFLMRLLLGLQMAAFSLGLVPLFSLCVYLCPNLLLRTHQSCGIRVHLNNLILPLLPLKTSISKYSHILRCWGWGFNIQNLGGWIQQFTRRRKWQPMPVSLTGKFHGWRSVAGYSPWDCKELDVTEQLHSQQFRLPWWLRW